MRIPVTFVLLFSIILIAPCASFAQSRDSISVKDKFTSAFAVDIRPSYAFSSYKDDILRDCLELDHAQKTTAALSFHLKYGFSFSSDSRQGRIYPGAWQGIGSGINLFGNTKGLGNPVAVYLFQGAPIYHFNKRLSLYYEWNFGISMGWKPCDGKTTHSNLIVGSKVNAYINLGGGLSWKLNKSLSFVAGLDLTHFSNGNTAFPNPGVNLIGLKFGLIQSFGRTDIDNPEKSDSYNTHPNGIELENLKKRRKISYDFSIYGGSRRRVYRGGEKPVLLNGHFAVAGVSFAPMWNVSRNFRTGLAADFQWDESTDLRRHHVSGETADDILFYRPPFINQVGVGLSARAELVMPIFSVNLGLGYNFIGPEESIATYQMANLKIYIFKSLYLNIGYQLQNFQKQSNLRLGVGFNLH